MNLNSKIIRIVLAVIVVLAGMMAYYASNGKTINGLQNAAGTAAKPAQEATSTVSAGISNLFENVTKKYDIIVSNPPYIPQKEINSLETEVKDFDPHLALFASDELGIYFYEKIIEKAADYLKDNGFILFETGINQCSLVKDILKSSNFKNIKIIEDLNKIERIITAQK